MEYKVSSYTFLAEANILLWYTWLKLTLNQVYFFYVKWNPVY